MFLLSVAGIGNTVLQSPLINALLKREEFEVDILFGDAGMKAVFEYDTRIKRAFTLPKSKVAQLRFIYELRKNRYDISIACFPSNRYEYNLLPFLIGARKRIIHSYRVGRIRALGFLSTEFVPVDESLHDVEQNMGLLQSCGIDPSGEPVNLSFSLSEENEKYAEDFLRGLDRRRILGIHPTGTRFLPEKDWPRERFKELVERVKEKFNVILFGTAQELDDYTSMPRVFLCDSSLNNAAALMKRCSIFLSVDTGLMHVAAAFGVKQVVLWGPTKFSRTRPWTKNATFIGRTDLEILKYPFEDTKARFHHPNPRSIMEQISVEDVVTTLTKQ